MSIAHTYICTCKHMYVCMHVKTVGYVYSTHTYIHTVRNTPPSSSKREVNAGESVMIDKSPYEIDREIFREDALLSEELARVPLLAPSRGNANAELPGLHCDDALSTITA